MERVESWVWGVEVEQARRRDHATHTTLRPQVQNLKRSELGVHSATHHDLRHCALPSLVSTEHYSPLSFIVYCVRVTNQLQACRTRQTLHFIDTHRKLLTIRSVFSTNTKKYWTMFITKNWLYEIYSWVRNRNIITSGLNISKEWFGIL
jgi:hypothetical protein